MSRHAPHSPDINEQGKCLSAVDWRGNRFHVGEEVMYCIGAGRGQMMAIGVVLQIKVTQRHRNVSQPCDSDDPDAFTRQWFEPGEYFKWVQVPFDEVTVQVRTLKTSGRWDNEERTKPAWINPMNVTTMRSVDKS